MPVLTVKGMPSVEVPNEPDYSPGFRFELWVERQEKQGELLGDLIDQLTNAVASVDELKISADGVSVFFPPDLVPSRLGKELVVFVDGLYEKPDRTEFVLSKLAVVIRDTLELWVKKYLPQCQCIEVFIRPINSNRVSTVNW